MKKIMDIYVGISASGKSTYGDATLREYPNGKRLNADDIREELYGDSKCQDNPKLVFKILFDRLTDMLSDDETDYIVIDNTSLTSKMRKRYIDLANTICPMFEHEYEVRLVFFPVDLKRSLEWNKKRERNVPDDVIEAQVGRYQGPSEFERANCTILDVNFGIRK